MAVFPPQKTSCVWVEGCSCDVPSVPFRLQAGTRVAVEMYFLQSKEEALPVALEALYNYSVLHPFPRLRWGGGAVLSSPQAFKGRTDQGLVMGGGYWDYKGVSTNNRKRVLPSSGSHRLARGGKGPGEGSADSASLCPQVGVVGGHAAQGQVVWGEDGRPLCFGKRQNPDQ